MIIIFSPAVVQEKKKVPDLILQLNASNKNDNYPRTETAYAAGSVFNEGLNVRRWKKCIST